MTDIKASLRRVARLILHGVMLVLVIAVVVGVGYGLFWLGGYWLLGGTLFGLISIPALNIVVGKHPGSGVLGTLLFTMGSVVNNGSALVYDEYESRIVPFDSDKNRVFVGGEWQSVSDEELSTYRVGLRPFAVTVDVENSLDDYVVSSEIRDPPVILEQRGGEFTCAPYEQPSEEDDCVLVDRSRYIERAGRSGTRLYNRAEEHALKVFGGDDRLSQLSMILLVIGNMLVMFIVTWVLLSL